MTFSCKKYVHNIIIPAWDGHHSHRLGSVFLGESAVCRSFICAESVIRIVSDEKCKHKSEFFQQ